MLDIFRWGQWPNNHHLPFSLVASWTIPVRLSVLLFLLCYFFVFSRNPSMLLMSRSLSELKYLYLHAIWSVLFYFFREGTFRYRWHCQHWACWWTSTCLISDMITVVIWIHYHFVFVITPYFSWKKRFCFGSYHRHQFWYWPRLIYSSKLCTSVTEIQLKTKIHIQSKLNTRWYPIQPHPVV